MTQRRCTRRTALAWSGLLCLLPSCQWDGHLNLLGYTTKPNYDCGIRTIRVPIFQNRTFRPGLEFDLTRAVIREIEAKTPYKVVSHCNADTELTGTITMATKNILNINQLNEIREGEVIINVEVVWKDLRSGKVLTQPIRRPGDPLPIEVLADSAAQSAAGSGILPNAVIGPSPFPTRPSIPAADTPADAAVDAAGGAPAPPPGAVLPIAPVEPAKPAGITVSARGRFIPELGQSITSGLQVSVDRLAVQIVNMMETPW